MIGSRIQSLSLRARTTAWYVGMLAIALAIFSVGIYVGVRTYLKQSLQGELTATVNTIINEDLARLSVKGERWALGEVRESYAESGPDLFVRVSADGQVLYQSADMREPPIHLDDIKLPTATSVKGTALRQHTHGRGVLIFSEPYAAADGRLFQVEAGASLLRMQQTLQWLGKILLIATFVILILAAVGGYLLMEQPLRPLVTLTEKAAGIGRKKLGERLPVIPTGDELERLTHSLNGMIDRLEQALAHNNRFSADASHELRTPLTIMRGELEEMLRMDELPPQAVDNLVSTLEEIDRMSRIVNSLMAITRLDVGGEHMDRQTVDLSELVETTTEYMQLLADEKGLPLICACEAGVTVHADSMRLKQVIVNLVDNAIKYTPAAPADGSDHNAAVRVTVSAHGSIAQMEVSDHGIGIASDSLPYVFDRFYRADYARSRGAGGVGLGLAIVRSIVTAHDGAVTLRSTEGQGSTITVTLPLVREDSSETKKQLRLQSI